MTLTYPGCPYTEVIFLLDCALPSLPLQPIHNGKDWTELLLVRPLLAKLSHEFIIVV